MAATATEQVINDGPRNLYLKYTIAGTTGDAASVFALGYSQRRLYGQPRLSTCHERFRTEPLVPTGGPAVAGRPRTHRQTARTHTARLGKITPPGTRRDAMEQLPGRLQVRDGRNDHRRRVHLRAAEYAGEYAHLPVGLGADGGSGRSGRGVDNDNARYAMAIHGAGRGPDHPAGRWGTCAPDQGASAGLRTARGRRTHTGHGRLPHRGSCQSPPGFVSLLAGDSRAGRSAISRPADSQRTIPLFARREAAPRIANPASR
ncbi:hypothetical protein LCGC14_2208580 [marine sediment metagenome]|uniref:Uncharacterized protein n=1 Tax=marine sediment metagenome TaxID=412755 RepID=A0A0F9FRU6_9ZZZZ